MNFPLRRGTLAKFIGLLSILIFAHRSSAALGDIAAQYSFAASAFTVHPTQPYIYATISSQNSVAIINTNTLVVEDTLFVGSNPTHLTLSPDGSKAYVATSGSGFVVVFDTASRMITDAFLVPQSQSPRDVVFANQNRLFVLTGSFICQMDASTGASTGPNVGGNLYIYGGQLRVSPDGNFLYYAATIGRAVYKYDVSGNTPVKTLSTATGDTGDDLELSHSGETILNAVGAPYEILVYRTSDFAILGTFFTSSSAVAVAFSPDDQAVYGSVATQGGIQVFDTNTFLQTGKITTPDTAEALAVEPSGRYLFAGYTDSYNSFYETIVYDTNRVVALGAASRALHGSIGYADVALPLTGAAGVECRSGGPTGDYSVVVTFAGNLPANPNPQATILSGTAMIGSGGLANGGSVTVSGSTITIPLTNVANAQTLQVQLSGIPNGATTSSMVVPMSVLVGDVNGDGAVNAADATLVRNSSGQTTNTANFRADINLDGAINSADAILVRARSGTGLTAPGKVSAMRAAENDN